MNIIASIESFRIFEHHCFHRIISNLRISLLPQSRANFSYQCIYKLLTIFHCSHIWSIHFRSIEQIIFESSNIIASIESFRIFEHHCFHRIISNLRISLLPQSRANFSYQCYKLSTIFYCSHIWSIHFRSIERIISNLRTSLLPQSRANFIYQRFSINNFSLFSYLIDQFSIDRTNLHFESKYIMVFH